MFKMNSDIQYLSDVEILKFATALDKDNDGFIDYEDVKSMLDQVHDEIAEHPKPHHLHHETRGDDDTHNFILATMGSSGNRISIEEFLKVVKQWNVPSLEQDKREEENNNHYMRSTPLGRRLHVYWAVHGPKALFIAIVVSLQIAFAVWQMVKYITEKQWRRALGWGVVLSKTTAGACKFNSHNDSKD